MSGAGAAVGVENPATEIARMMVLSTQHLASRTATEWMPICPWSCFEKGEYGWFIYVACDGVTDERTVPLEVRSALHVARQAGCEWVMFDRDGPVRDDLPHYEW